MNRRRLIDYYEDELRFVRGAAASEFKRLYPDKAGELGLEANRCTDPHVERLIEAFAFLTARVQMRLDDEFPEITDAFLGVLYPHYLAPIPSMTIVQFHPDPEQVVAAKGIQVERDTVLDSILQYKGVPCRFRTCYPVELWPVEIASVDAIPLKRGEPACPEKARAALRIRLKTLEGRSFSELGLNTLCFYLDGTSEIVHGLYEAFFSAPVGIVLKFGSSSGGQETSVFLEAEHLRPRGFERDEGLLPYPPGSNLGYRILHEYFVFPEKFHFGELTGLDRGRQVGLGDTLDILVLLEQPADGLVGRLRTENLKLGCTPAVNLFPKPAEPLTMEHTRVEYDIVPHRPTRAYEVYSVEDVYTTTPGVGEKKPYRPFYELRHGDARLDGVSFWYARRRPTSREATPGTDVSLVLVDHNSRPLQQKLGDVLHAELLCTNRDLPAQLPVYGAEGASERGDFQVQGQPAIQLVRCLSKPTEPCWAPQQQASRWRVISHLSLNHLSIVEDDPRDGESVARDELAEDQPEGRALRAFREILKLYDFRDSPVTQQRISGLSGVRSWRVPRQLVRSGAATYARGLEVHLHFDEDKYVGSGVFLFASVLERFLGLYTSINSFTQTVVHVKQRQGVLKKWPPRAGAIQLL